MPTDTSGLQLGAGDTVMVLRRSPVAALAGIANAIGTISAASKPISRFRMALSLLEGMTSLLPRSRTRIFDRHLLLPRERLLHKPPQHRRIQTEHPQVLQAS
jgi:hypothetical protein